MDKPNLTLGDALVLLDKVDDLYFEVYVEVCELKGIPRLGRPGKLLYVDVAAVADAIEQRYVQINELRAAREELLAEREEALDTNSRRVWAVVENLGID